MNGRGSAGTYHVGSGRERRERERGKAKCQVAKFVAKSEGAFVANKKKIKIDPG